MNRTVGLDLLYSEKQIADEVRRLAGEITLTYNDSGEELVVAVVLKGAFFFASDLARQIKLPILVDFVKLSSYNGMNTTGRITMTKDMETPLAGKNVIILDDIIDTGISLEFLRDRLIERNPKSLKICTLIDKSGKRQRDVTADFVGFHCSGGFLVGYGLDLDEKFRELPAIYMLR